MPTTMSDNFLDHVNFDGNGLVAAIAQDANTGRILMMAWMNREALSATVAKGEAVYFSRSRQALWHKGERSGHTQKVKEIRLDCDGDMICLQVDQVGGIACHTGRESCLFRILKDGQWHTTDTVLKDPNEMYS